MKAYDQSLSAVASGEAGRDAEGGLRGIHGPDLLRQSQDGPQTLADKDAKPSRLQNLYYSL